MTDILRTIPDLDTSSYAHILPSLERSLVSVNDILILGPLDVAKRASVPSAEIRRLKEDVIGRLQSQLTTACAQHHDDGQGQWATISTLDRDLDRTLEGGFPTRHLTEITGESAAGKTQLLLSLCLAVQLPAPHGVSKAALYITTEGPLQTSRLSQILRFNPLLDTIAPPFRPSLSRIHSIKVSDLEAQEHILQYQVPVAIERHDIGLIVIDSVAANFRAEFDVPTTSTTSSDKQKSKRLAFNERNAQLVRLGTHLQSLAQKHDLAIVVANQVLDRFVPLKGELSQPTPASQLSRASSQHRSGNLVSQLARTAGSDATNAQAQAPDPPAELILSTPDPLSLEHQMRFNTGWGDTSLALTSSVPFSSTAAAHVRYHAQHPKTPSLGHVWTSQLSARIVLLKSPVYRDHDYRLGIRSERDIVRWRRGVKVVFAPWTDGCNEESAHGIDGDRVADKATATEDVDMWAAAGAGTGGIGKEVEIWEGGVRAVKRPAVGRDQ